MNLRRVFLVAAILLSAIGASGQAVAIVAKKTVYHRPKPIMDYKRTFSVRRPTVKAATPNLSRKITAAVSPEIVLGLNLKEEMGEYQWLEEADYDLIFNRGGILCLRSWMTGTAAYPDDVTRYVVVDTRTGRRMRAADMFSNLRGLTSATRKMQLAEIARASVEIKKDPENVDVDPAGLFADADFKVKDLDSFFVDANGVVFVYDYGFPHVLTAVQPDGEYRFSWNQIRPYIKRGGLLAQFIR
ncbi:MAG TPA: hypothetical protein VK468_02300 [Pyrinomonadaceae bacterium]|nr:hypothetical protein [Pyrinomonadaceae bacterium]